MTSPIGSNVLNTVNAGSAAEANARQSADLRDNFMTLLITQLENQDPLNPMENSDVPPGPDQHRQPRSSTRP